MLPDVLTLQQVYELARSCGQAEDFNKVAALQGQIIEHDEVEHEQLCNRGG